MLSVDAILTTKLWIKNAEISREAVLVNSIPLKRKSLIAHGLCLNRKIKAICIKE